MHAIKCQWEKPQNPPNLYCIPITDSKLKVYYAIKLTSTAQDTGETTLPNHHAMPWHYKRRMETRVKKQQQKQQLFVDVLRKKGGERTSNVNEVSFPF